MEVDRDIVTHELNGVQFGYYSTDEVRRMSAKQITNSSTFDRLRNPTACGLYDPALGPIDKNARCVTCSQSYVDCPGHTGHIELALKLYQPMLFGQLYKLLRVSCWSCNRFLSRREELDAFEKKFRLLNDNKIVEAFDIGEGDDGDEDMSGAPKTKFVRKTQRMHAAWDDLVKDFFSFSGKRCHQCGKPRRNVTKEGVVRMLLHPVSKKNQEMKGIVRKNTAQKDAVSDAKNKKDKNDDKNNKNSEFFDSDNEDEDEDENSKGDDSDDNNADANEEVNEEDMMKNPTLDSKPQFLHPEWAYQWISSLFKNEPALTQLLFGATIRRGGVARVRADPGMFFVACQPVTPSRFRAPMEFGGMSFDHPHNALLGGLIKHNESLIRELKVARAAAEESGERGKKFSALNVETVMKSWLEMQTALNALFDSSKGGKDADLRGLRQDLERKEGLLRMNMMGKRVNFACRSVISPDPYIATDEIGIPEVFATRLSYSEPVTAHNVDEMRQRVINGAEKHPGANFVVDEKGNRINLAFKGESFRVALAKQLLRRDLTSGRGRRVGRHMQNGDIVLVNRQPTLHRASIMAHRVRVMTGQKTIRMHYANCNSYNADFDGDEINVHLPQDELGRAEAYNLVGADKHYISPCNAKPLRGLIQDHVASGVLLTKLDTFFNRDEYMQLVYQACAGMKLGKGGSIKLLPPAIFAPKQVWTGKQVISTVLHNVMPLSHHSPLSVSFAPKVRGDAWGKHNLDEGVARFVDHELVTGVLDKAAFGASEFGLIHAVHQVYGPTKAGLMLSVLGRLLTAFMQWHGFTCGMQDLIITQDADANRRAALDKADSAALLASARFAGVGGDDDLDVSKSREDDRLHAVVQAAVRHKLREDPRNRAALDGRVKQFLSSVTSAAIDASVPVGQMIAFPANTMALMTTTGAKGSKVNHTQICSLLGQQELEGLRVPLMPNGKSLPCFHSFDLRARAGGFIGDRFLTGIRPQEFYFHCMAGREGLIDTAVKTCRSGYLQRCLMKHLESIVVQYDYTARDTSDGSIIQFAYGEDALDVQRTSGLNWFSIVSQNPSAFAATMNAEQVLEAMDRKAANHRAKLRRRAARKGEDWRQWRAAAPPLTSTSNLARDLGAVSDKFDDELETYIASDPEKLLAQAQERLDRGASEHKAISADGFRDLMYIRYSQCLVDPGEAVGAVAAQSIGEPSTQMTLNTFHSAGQGGNVTLGIPRLREIVMTATKEPIISSMTLSLLPNFIKKAGGGKAAAKVVADRLERVSLADFIDRMSVEERVATIEKKFLREYTVKAVCKDLAQVCATKDGVNVDQVVAALKGQFADWLLWLCLREIRRAARIAKTRGVATSQGFLGGAQVKAKEGKVLEEDGDDENGGANDEETSGKGRRRKDMDSDGEDSDDEDGDENDEEQEGSKLGDNEGYENADADDLEALKHSGNKDDDEDEDDEGKEKDASSSSDKKNKKKKGSKGDDEEDEEDEEPIRTDAMANLSTSLRMRFRCSVAWDKEASTLSVIFHLLPDARKMMVLSIAEKAAEKVLLKETKNIKKTFVLEPAMKGSDDYKVQTDGVNFRALGKLTKMVNINSVRTSDIYQLLVNYGVEACNAGIREELRAVFAAYGIAVNSRHLSLIADQMTFNGGYRPMNRASMAMNSSPFLKMSFETTCRFLTDATFVSDRDELSSPSSRIAVGQTVHVGTNTFRLLHPLTPSHDSE